MLLPQLNIENKTIFLNRVYFLLFYKLRNVLGYSKIVIVQLYLL